MKSCNKCGVELVLGLTWTEARKKHHMNFCNICSHTKSKEWKQANKVKAKESAKYTKTKYYYGVTREQYLSMYAITNGCCFICGEHESKFKHGLHIDHNHSTGKVRGLLCTNCNTALGKFKESKKLLDKAKDYLDKHADEN